MYNRHGSISDLILSSCNFIILLSIFLINCIMLFLMLVDGKEKF